MIGTVFKVVNDTSVGAELALQGVENAWYNAKQEYWLDQDGGRISRSPLPEDVLQNPGFAIMASGNDLTGEIILVTSSRTDEGVWMFQGWYRDFMGSMNKVTMGIYLPSQNSGSILYMPHEEVEEEERQRSAKGLDQLPYEVMFMRWQRYEHEDASPIYRAGTYLTINADEYGE